MSGPEEKSSEEEAEPRKGAGWTDPDNQREQHGGGETTSDDDDKSVPTYPKTKSSSKEDKEEDTDVEPSADVEKSPSETKSPSDATEDNPPDDESSSNNNHGHNKNANKNNGNNNNETLAASKKKSSGGEEKKHVEKKQSHSGKEKGEPVKMDVDSEVHDGADDENESTVQTGKDGEGGEDGTQPDASEENTNSKAELPYSTRGRSTGSDASGTAGENWERSAREALDEIGRVKEPPPTTLGTSFLESLSEEERRTRTRFLPDVDGMHTLRKIEIKGDLALARSMVPGGTTNIQSSRKSKAKRIRSDDDSMDVDDEEGASPSDDDRTSDSAKIGSSTIEFKTMDLVLPSNVFVPPPGGGEALSSGDGEDEREGHPSSSSTSKSQTEVVSPFVVESVTAFNPPRPPESIGAKKQHRMLRWERRPDDVEVDLNNYNKTVQRTRQELHTAEAEKERLETLQAHLRRHFLSHLEALKEEYVELNEEIGKVQQECVKAADLLTSRTRSRGAGKGSYVMRDVLTILKARGAEVKEAESTDAPEKVQSACQLGGIGGVSGASFMDWNQSTSFSLLKPANAWLFPGDEVITPYGEGTVLEVIPLDARENKDSKGSSHGFSGDTGINKQNRSSKGGASSKNDAQKLTGKRRRDDSRSKGMKGVGTGEVASRNGLSRLGDLESLLPPRVSVRLQYGIGYFMVGVVTSKENPSSYSDAELAHRWKEMHKYACDVGPSLDQEGMASIKEPGNLAVDESDDLDNEEKSQMDLEDGARKPESSKSDDASGIGTENDARRRLLPFGSSLLPTSSGRGRLLYDLSMAELEKGSHAGLTEGGGVLGSTHNVGVPSEYKNGDEYHLEYCTLQASVLQLRNELCRQRRIRILNERTFAATRDRSDRVEGLVAEMRADLKSLKARLDEELHELGIDEDAAEQILTSFYQEQDGYDELDDVAQPKRQRRMERPNEDDVVGEDAKTARNFADDKQGAPAEEVAGDDMSGDELEAHRASKKERPNQ